MDLSITLWTLEISGIIFLKIDHLPDAERRTAIAERCISSDLWH